LFSCPYYVLERKEKKARKIELEVGEWSTDPIMGDVKMTDVSPTEAADSMEMDIMSKSLGVKKAKMKVASPVELPASNKSYWSCSL
jgi:hypothetical protein